MDCATSIAYLIRIQHFLLLQVKNSALKTVHSQAVVSLFVINVFVLYCPSMDILIAGNSSRVTRV